MCLQQTVCVVRETESGCVVPPCHVIVTNTSIDFLEVFWNTQKYLKISYLWDFRVLYYMNMTIDIIDISMIIDIDIRYSIFTRQRQLIDYRILYDPWSTDI